MAAYPTPGTYTIDPTHASVEVTARHLVITKVRGTFAGISGEVVVGDTPEASSVKVTIDASTIDTRVADRDAHLRSEDFLDVENHPTIEFVSTGVRKLSDSSFELTGDLTLRGVTKSITFPFEYGGVVADPWGNEKVHVAASTTVNREEFGLTWNATLESGGVLVSKDLEVDIALELAKA